MSNLTNPSKELMKTPVPNPQKSLEILSVNAVEVKPTRTVQEFIESLDKATLISRQYEKSLVRIKEIRSFLTKISDGSSTSMIISHVLTDSEIEFPHVQVIEAFIKERLIRGEEEILDLEMKMKAFSL